MVLTKTGLEDPTELLGYVDMLASASNSPRPGNYVGSRTDLFTVLAPPRDTIIMPREGKSRQAGRPNEPMTNQPTTHLNKKWKQNNHASQVDRPKGWIVLQHRSIR